MKPRKTRKKIAPPSGTFSWFFASALYGTVFSKLYLTHFNFTNSYDAHTYFRLYAIGWMIALLTSVAAIFPLKFIREKWFAKESSLFPLLALANLAFALYLYHPAQWSKPNLLIYFLLVQPIVFLSALLLDRRGAYWTKVNLLYVLMVLLGLGWVTLVAPGWWRMDDWKIHNYVLFVLVVAAVLLGARSISRPEKALPVDWTFGNIRVRKSLLLYLLAFLTIGFCINTLFNYDPHHYSYYLGPVMDLAGGKSLLVNINCQYGVLVIYFLRFCFFFLPVSLVSFSLLLVIITTIQYLLFYFVARHLLRSEPLAFSALVVLLIVQHLAQINLGILFPSVGPLRFGFIYVLMALIILRNRYPARRDLLLWMETLVTGTAFFWSLEVCVYVVLPYLGLLFFESFDFRGQFRFQTQEFFRRLGMLTGCILLTGGLLYLDVFRRSGEWPHWSYYLDYLTTYGNGYGMLQLPPLHAWWVVVFILYFSFFAILGILFSKTKPLPPNLNVVVILLFCGILEFTYYCAPSPHQQSVPSFHAADPAVLLLALFHPAV